MITFVREYGERKYYKVTLEEGRFDDLSVLNPLAYCIEEAEEKGLYRLGAVVPFRDYYYVIVEKRR